MHIMGLATYDHDYNCRTQKKMNRHRYVSGNAMVFTVIGGSLSHRSWRITFIKIITRQQTVAFEILTIHYTFQVSQVLVPSFETRQGERGGGLTGASSSWQATTTIRWDMQ